MQVHALLRAPRAIRAPSARFFLVLAACCYFECPLYCCMVLVVGCWLLVVVVVVDCCCLAAAFALCTLLFAFLPFAGRWAFLATKKQVGVWSCCCCA